MTNTAKPRRKLVACVSTAEFRRMVADHELRSPGWTTSFRRPGNTIPVVHKKAHLALFGPGDIIYLCSEPEKRI